MLILFIIYIDTQQNNQINQEKYIGDIMHLPDDYNALTNDFNIHNKFIMDIFSNCKNYNSCFILGKHKLEWIAKYDHHSFLPTGCPVIVIANDDEYFSKIENIINEIKSRHAKIILITNNKNSDIDATVDYVYRYESNSLLFPLMSVVPLQFIAYHLALHFGHNPDYPRNLAKVVTVD